jgi:hypothetical protein
VSWSTTDSIRPEIQTSETEEVSSRM